MSKQAVNFQHLVDQVYGQEVDSKALAIWGGTCPESKLSAFIQGWDLSTMPYCIWEHASEIVFQEGTLPAEAGLLERGRLFGPGGDLSLRRDGDVFRWHFVGRAGAKPPAGPYGTQDFWQATGNEDARFHQATETAQLWGERKEGFDLWFEDRVAGARLQYPTTHTGRVQIRYATFSRAGRVEFVWLRELEVCDE